MTQYGFHFDGSRCTGCKTCMLACKDFKDLGSDMAYRQVIEYATGTGFTADETGAWTTDTHTYYLSLACNHCDNPACLAACQTGALSKDPKTGLVIVDQDKCNGCGNCTKACPYGAPHMDAQTGKMQKCDGCNDRVKAGKLPICVEACPVRALDFGPIDELQQKYGDLAAIAPMPNPDITKPNLTIIAPTCVEAWDERTGVIENDHELIHG